MSADPSDFFLTKHKARDSASMLVDKKSQPGSSNRHGEDFLATWRTLIAIL